MIVFMSLLIILIMSEHKESIKELLVAPDPNLEYDCCPFIKSKKFTLLMKLVLLTREYPEIEKYIEEYVKINKDELDKKNKKGWTPLMLACINSKSTETTFKLLIDAGADLNLRNNNGRTVLMSSARHSNIYGYGNTVKMLIDAGADLNLKDTIGRTALLLSARYSNTANNENTVKMLIDAGADLNLKDINGRTALMLSVRYSNTDSNENTVKMLIDAGADLNLKDTNGRTALMLSVRYSNTASNENTVKMLIDAGADFNLRKNNGFSAIMIAAKYSSNIYNSLKMLIDNQKNDRRNNLINELKINGIEIRDDSIICKNYIENGEKDGNSLYGIVDIMTEMNFYYEKTSYRELLQSTRGNRRSNGNYLVWLPYDEENLRKLVKERCLEECAKFYVKDPYKMELEVPNILKKRINDLCEKLLKLNS